MKKTIILLYYKYTHVERPKDIVIQQRALCAELGLKGRILIAQEGINGTLEGCPESVDKYKEYMEAHKHFSGIKYKESSGIGTAFPKLVVKARKEIVSSYLGEEDIDPNEITGEYISAEQLHEWYEGGKKFKIVDMRNDYEQAVGLFEGSLLPGLENFRDLKKTAEKLQDLKEEEIVTVCTGGVRCEKASGFLKSQGFKKVYQLQDGIFTYMQKFPNKHFKGKLYVFDNRIVIGFDHDSPDHEIIGTCTICGGKSESYVNCADPECHKHFICCQDCRIDGLAFCQNACRTNFERQVKALA